jgi:hypothetical protein
MRRALNENPLVQAGLIGVLALIIAVVMLMRMGGGSSESPSPDAGAVAPVPPEAATAEPAGGAPPTVPGATPPASDSASAAGGFEAGPGLPRPVVTAYDAGDIVVLLVVRENGIDDRRLRAIVERLRTRSDTALFVVRAKGIVRYSRIAQGVEVDRTPALVVLVPKGASEGPMPVATVSYGFRGPGSVEQAVEDAAYEGPSDLPYYPR